MRLAAFLAVAATLGCLALPGCGDGVTAAADGGRDLAPLLDGGAEAATAADAAGDVRPDADADAAPDGTADAAGDGAGDGPGVADSAPADTGAPDGASGDCPAYPPSDLQDEWTAVQGLTGTTLRDALLTIVAGHTELAYDEAKAALFGAGGIDVHGGVVECVYTGQQYLPEQLDQTGGFNTEHSWPQSEFPGAAGTTPKSDLHHLFPTEPDANSRRSSYPYGDTDCTVSLCDWQGGGSELGPRIGGSEKVFEVRPPRRGEIARAHFYFAVRYAAPIPAFEEEALRRWHRCDPPDAVERARNDAIEAVQGNRNPFIDRPEFVDQIADY